MAKRINLGNAINRLELEIARAAMKGDKVAEDKAIRLLEAVVARTDMAAFIG